VRSIAGSAACLLGFAFAFAALPAPAVELTLEPNEIAAAVGEGGAMAARGTGYAIGTYLLFGVDDALHIADDDQTIEAVIVATPYERLRFHAYLLAHEGRPAPGSGDQFVAGDRDVLEIVVYAHSRGVGDREFMQHFGAGTLASAETTREAAQVTSTDPVIDSYYLSSGAVVKRWLGQVTYRFNLRDDPALAAATTPATFSFLDDRGAAHRYTLNLAGYR
jgi:hypothetical protein